MRYCENNLTFDAEMSVIFSHSGQVVLIHSDQVEKNALALILSTSNFRRFNGTRKSLRLSKVVLLAPLYPKYHQMFKKSMVHSKKKLTGYLMGHRQEVRGDPEGGIGSPRCFIIGGSKFPWMIVRFVVLVEK